MLPKDFVWGFATASAQVEGYKNNEDVRGKSIWDKFCAQVPSPIRDGSSPALGTDTYNRFREDIALMKKHGVKAYRFSISWSRVIPLGGKGDPVSQEGIDFYNSVIDCLLENNITPYVTLYHWDLPLALQERYSGFLSKTDILRDYVNYAELCFKTFGDRVKHWITFNEPWCSSVLGWAYGVMAPGIKSNIKPWIVGHNTILSHAYAVKVYREKYKPTQQGIIGITLNGDYAEPYDNAPETHKAVEAKNAAAIGWFADPIYLGFYPPALVEIVGDRLPAFEPEEMEIVKGSSDFYGCNCYTSNLIKAGGDDEHQGNAIFTFERSDGTQLGNQSECTWLQDYPAGFRKHLNYLWNRYRTPIYMTENGFAVKGENDFALADALNDTQRVNYYRGHLNAMKDAIELDGVDIRSYFAWSFQDNFEWAEGYVVRFGSVHIDYKTMKRTPKASAAFIQKWFNSNVAK